jgi:hypothetical protein
MVSIQDILQLLLRPFFAAGSVLRIPVGARSKTGDFL